MTEKPTPQPWETRKTTKLHSESTSFGEDSEEHYDVIDMQIEAQKAVRTITDHQEIVKQYQKVVRYFESESNTRNESEAFQLHNQCWVVGPCRVAKQNKEGFL